MEKYTRTAARAQGLKQYWTDKPCSAGHVGQRFASSDVCVECSRIKARNWHRKQHTADPIAHNAKNAQRRRDLKLRRAGRPPPSACECCGATETRLIYDHCHETGKFRGWICDLCNTGIGKLGDNSRNVMRAVEYLRRTES